MIEVYKEYPRRYIVTNKNKILLVTYDHRIAERIEYDLKNNDYPAHYMLRVDESTNNNGLVYKRT